ncbi:MAG: hypothetical protein QOH08_2530 [Chloroflexota bacterium]|nr:hypothetical protein [Chloroflexota bacterium]
MRRAEGPAYRRHTALKVAAAVARVFSVIVVAATFAGAAATLVSLRPAVAPFVVEFSGAAAVFFLFVGLMYSVLLWAAADALILLADGDDAHRLTQFQLEQVNARLDALGATGQRTDETERLAPPPPGP